MTSQWPGADAGHLLPPTFAPLVPKDYLAVLSTFRMVLYFLAADPCATWLWTPSQTCPEVCFSDAGVSQVHNQV